MIYFYYNFLILINDYYVGFQKKVNLHRFKYLKYFGNPLIYWNKYIKTILELNLYLKNEINI